MRPFQSILHPTDFSPHSAVALERACDLAARYAAALTLLHVFQIPSPPMPEGYVLPSYFDIPEVMAANIRRLDGLVEQARRAGVLELHQEVVEGTPFVEIVAYARNGGHDLIVMGTHGHTGIKHALLGSVAERVVRKAPCAVLTVRLIEN